MHRVAPKVAVKIAVFLDDDDFDTGAGQKISEHEPGGAAAGDAAIRLDSLLAGSQRRRNRVFVIRIHGSVRILPVGALRKLLRKT
jgi:hypothetical protein